MTSFCEEVRGDGRGLYAQSQHAVKEGRSCKDTAGTWQVDSVKEAGRACSYLSELLSRSVPHVSATLRFYFKIIAFLPQPKHRM